MFNKKMRIVNKMHVLFALILIISLVIGLIFQYNKAKGGIGRIKVYDIKIDNFEKSDLILDSKLLDLFNNNIDNIKQQMEYLNAKSLNLRKRDISEEEWIMIFSSLILNYSIKYGAISNDLTLKANKLPAIERFNFMIKNVVTMHCGHYPLYAEDLSKKIAFLTKQPFQFLEYNKILTENIKSDLHYFGFFKREGDDFYLIIDPTYNIFGFVNFKDYHKNVQSNFFLVKNQNSTDFSNINKAQQKFLKSFFKNTNKEFLFNFDITKAKRYYQPNCKIYTIKEFADECNRIINT